MSAIAFCGSLIDKSDAASENSIKLAPEVMVWDLVLNRQR
jgi:hypothetical protein